MLMESGWSGGKDTLSSLCPECAELLGLSCDKGGPGEATKHEDYGAGGQY